MRAFAPTHTDVPARFCHARATVQVCGNIAATPLDIARFHFDLQSGRIVSNESLVQMNAFYNHRPVDAGTCIAFHLLCSVADYGALLRVK